MIIGAPNSALIVDIGSGYVKRLQMISQMRSKFAPTNAVAATVVRWLEVWNSPRAICGTATPTNAIGPQKAVIPPANRQVAITIIRRVRSILTPKARA